MDIKNLQYFVTVVECTSITKAAKALHISQPPLSQQLKILEAELGTKLFERGSRNITLTDAGETLYQRAKIILDYTEETCREIKDIGNGNNGKIRMGTISSINPAMLANVISDFSEEYPNVQFEIFERNTYELLDSLENNLIELAFVRTPFDTNKKHEKILMGKDSLVAFAHKDFFKNVTTEMLEPEFFNNKPVIIYRRWKFFFNNYFAERGISPVYWCINDDAKTALLLALSGKGIAILPKSITPINSDENMFYVPVDSEILTTEVYAIWNPDRFVSPAMQNFIEVLKSFELD